MSIKPERSVQSEENMFIASSQSGQNILEASKSTLRIEKWSRKSLLGVWKGKSHTCEESSDKLIKF